MGRAAFVMAAALLLTGCTVWRERPLTAPTPAALPHNVRVTIEHGARRLTLQRASVRADSVVGILFEAHVRRGDDWKRDATLPSGDSVAIAWRDVWSIEEGHTSATRSLVLFAVMVALAAYVAFIIGLEGMD